MRALSAVTFKVTDRSLDDLRSAGVPDGVLQKLTTIEGQEATGKRDFVSLLQQVIGYQETVSYGKLIQKHAKVKRRKRSGLKKPSLPHYVWKVIQSTILGAVILLAIFGLEWLTVTLFPKEEHIPIDIINVSKNWVSAGMFVVFLIVKVLHNLGIIKD